MPGTTRTARWNATFGGDGRVDTPIPGSFRLPNAFARAVAIAPDGRIIAAGSRLSGGAQFPNSPFVVVRYNSDGTLDTSFSGDGISTLFFPTGGDPIAFAEDLAIQPDGRIVAVGFSSGGSFLAIARYNPDGSVDASFDGDGITWTSFGAAAAMILQPDGRIVAVGTASSDFGLAKFTAAGALDNSFGAGGKLQTDFTGVGDVGRAAAGQPDGRIIAAGFTTASGDTADFALARYATNGALDPTFGQGGKVITDFARSEDQLQGVVVQSDGRVVAAGRSGDDFGLARYNPDGSLDPVFGRCGKVTTDFANTFDEGRAVALQPDGKIIVVGQSVNASADFAVARYNPNGTLDPTFG